MRSLHFIKCWTAFEYIFQLVQWISFFFLLLSLAQKTCCSFWTEEKKRTATAAVKFVNSHIECRCWNKSKIKLFPIVNRFRVNEAMNEISYFYTAFCHCHVVLLYGSRSCLLFILERAHTYPKDYFKLQFPFIKSSLQFSHHCVIIFCFVFIALRLIHT